MINGIHALLYSKDADATRAFFRDVLELGLYEPRHPTALSLAARAPA